MSENPTLVASRLRTASVLFSAAALILITMGLLLSWSRVAVLIAPVLMGAAALVFAVRARRSAPAKRNGSLPFVPSALAIVGPPATVTAVLVAGALTPSAVYRLTVDSADPVTVTIRDGADSTTDQWNAGRSITVESSQPVVGITVKSSVDTTMVSCEILRDGITVAADERAGSVDCSFIAGGD